MGSPSLVVLVLAPDAVEDDAHGHRGFVDAVVGRVRADLELSGAVVARPVTDTLKAVDDRGDLLGTADRGAWAQACGPAAYRPSALVRALRDHPDADAVEPLDLPGLVVAAGGRVAVVDPGGPVPAEQQAVPVSPAPRPPAAPPPGRGPARR